MPEFWIRSTAFGESDRVRPAAVVVTCGDIGFVTAGPAGMPMRLAARDCVIVTTEVGYCESCCEPFEVPELNLDDDGLLCCAGCTPAVPEPCPHAHTAEAGCEDVRHRWCIDCRTEVQGAPAPCFHTFRRDYLDGEGWVCVRCGRRVPAHAGQGVQP